MFFTEEEKKLCTLRSRRKFLTDLASDLATSEDNGFARGLLLGRAEGRAEVRAEGESARILDIARHLLSIHLPPDEIARLTGLSLAEIEGL